MPVTLRCPSCNKKLSIPRKFAGRSIPCPNCGAPFDVPAAGQEPAPTPSPAPRRTAPAADDPFAFMNAAAPETPSVAPAPQSAFDFEAPTAPPPPPTSAAAPPRRTAPAAPAPAPYYAPRTAAPARPPRPWAPYVWILLTLLLGIGALPLALQLRIHLVGLLATGIGACVGLTAVVLSSLRRGAGLALASACTLICVANLFVAWKLGDGLDTVRQAAERLGVRESKVTRDNYDKLKPGMTLAEVEDLLGRGRETLADEIPEEVREQGVAHKVSGWYRWMSDDRFVFVGTAAAARGAKPRVAVVAYRVGGPEVDPVESDVKPASQS